jgi:dihydroorotate dehydrogenase electron transfer subunit
MDAIAHSSASRRTVAILENNRIAAETYRIRLDDPALARSIRPGQFLMIKPAAGTGTDPLLARPFALYDVVLDESGLPIALDVVYMVIGRGTSCLSRLRAGDLVTIWGPLGNGFGDSPGGSVLFVAGGIGQTPFLSLGRWWLGSRQYGGGLSGGTSVESATLLYGVRTGNLAAGLDDFAAAGISVELATDDGSLGHHGYVTDLLARRMEAGEKPSRVVGCGPPSMLRVLSKLVEKYDVPCDLSLENHMACGFGACFSCVAPIRQGDGSTDLRRVCVEGPIFSSRDVVWTASGH